MKKKVVTLMVNMANSVVYAQSVMIVMEILALLMAMSHSFDNVGQHYSVAFVGNSNSTAWLT